MMRVESVNGAPAPGVHRHLRANVLLESLDQFVRKKPKAAAGLRAFREEIERRRFRRVREFYQHPDPLAEFRPPPPPTGYPAAVSFEDQRK